MSGIYRGVNGSATADALNIDGDKGDLTISNSGLEWTINPDAVDFSKMQNISTDVLLGRATSGSGDIEEITCTAAGRALLDDADASAQRTTLGLGNAATATIGTNVLAFDSNLQGFVDTFTLPTTDATNGFVLTTNGAGTLSLNAPGGIPDGDKGDISVSSGGTVWSVDTDAITTTKILDDSVTYSKIQNVSATDKLLGRSSSGAGNIEEITCTSAGRALLDDVDNTAQRTTLGLGSIATLNSIANANISANTIALDKLAREGTSGQVLTSNGTGADATYTTLNRISQLDSSVRIIDSGSNGMRELTLDGVIRERQTASTRLSTIEGGSTLYPEFKCRAWVNFNGTGTVAIRASGNVSSITDNGAGDYTVNFTTAMPDANYSVGQSVGNGSSTSDDGYWINERTPDTSRTASAIRVVTKQHGAAAGWIPQPCDVTHISVNIFR